MNEEDNVPDILKKLFSQLDSLDKALKECLWKDEESEEISSKCFSDLWDWIYHGRDEGDSGIGGSDSGIGGSNSGIGRRNSEIGVIPGFGGYNCKKIILVLNIPDLLKTYPYRRFIGHFLFEMIEHPIHKTSMNSATSIDFLYQRFMLELTKYYIDKCKEEEKQIYIVFYSTAWNSKLWIEYERYFRDHKSYLRMVDSKETILRV